MASIIRSPASLISSSRPFFTIQSAGFASSSRHGLDFTKPLRFPSPTKTTTLLEENPLTESHETPSTSNATPEPIPTPQPQPSLKSIPTPTPTPSASQQPKLHTPQISTSSPTIQRNKGNTKGQPKFRWLTPDKKLNGVNEQDQPTHTLHVKSSRNNIILSLTDGLGPIFSNISGGSDKQFKNSQRSTYESATQASIKMFDKILEYYRSQPPTHKMNITLSFNGLFGMGREALASALSGPEGQEIRSLIRRVEDKTRIKIGGTRAKKPRRL